MRFETVRERDADAAVHQVGGAAHWRRGRRLAGSARARTTTEYAPLSRAHCCFFCWTSDAGLLTDSIAPHYSLHFLMPRIAHTLRFVLPQLAGRSAVTVHQLMSAF